MAYAFFTRLLAYHCCENYKLFCWETVSLDSITPVSSQDLYCFLPRDQSRDVTPRLGVCVVLELTDFRICIFIAASIITNM